MEIENKIKNTSIIQCSEELQEFELLLESLKADLGKKISEHYMLLAYDLCPELVNPFPATILLQGPNKQTVLKQGEYYEQSNKPFFTAVRDVETSHYYVEHCHFNRDDYEYYFDINLSCTVQNIPLKNNKLEFFCDGEVSSFIAYLANSPIKVSIMTDNKTIFSDFIKINTALEDKFVSFSTLSRHCTFSLIEGLCLPELFQFFSINLPKTFNHNTANLRIRLHLDKQQQFSYLNNIQILTNIIPLVNIYPSSTEPLNLQPSQACYPLFLDKSSIYKIIQTSINNYQFSLLEDNFAMYVPEENDRKGILSTKVMAHDGLTIIDILNIDTHFQNKIIKKNPQQILFDYTKISYKNLFDYINCSLATIDNLNSLISHLKPFGSFNPEFSNFLHSIIDIKIKQQTCFKQSIVTERVKVTITVNHDYQYLTCYFAIVRWFWQLCPLNQDLEFKIVLIQHKVLYHCALRS